MTTPTTTIGPTTGTRRVVVARCKWCTQKIEGKKAGTPGRAKTDFCSSECKREARNSELRQGALVLRLAKRWRRSRGTIKGSFNEFTRALDLVISEDHERRVKLQDKRKAAEAEGRTLSAEEVKFAPFYRTAEFIDQIR